MKWIMVMLIANGVGGYHPITIETNDKAHCATMAERIIKLEDKGWLETKAKFICMKKEKE